MNNKKLTKGIIIGVIVCTLILVGFIGSYAFFINAIGNNKNEYVSVQTGTLSLTFSDGSSSFQGSLDFAESATKSFKIENTGDIDAVGHINWLNLKNTYTFGSLTYTLQESTSEEGPYTNLLVDRNVPISANPMTIALSDTLEIPSNTTKYYKLIITLNYLEHKDQTPDLNAMLTTEFSLEDGEVVLDSKTILAKLGKTAKEGNPVFAEQATTDETKDGLYALEDDYGTSYYYRGDVTDNYVKFGTWASDTPDVYHGHYSATNAMVMEYSSLSACQSASSYNYNCTKISKARKSMYWRIIRVNGDGSVRLLYDGTEPHTNSDESSDRIAWASQVFNEKYDDAKYVGYMFGGSQGSASSKRVNLGATGYTDTANAINNQTNSNIKTKLEAWYVKNLSSQDEYIEDSIFCNDRSIPGKSLSGWSYDTGLGYAQNMTSYGAYMRSAVVSSNTGKYNPMFTCTNKNDAFTKEESEKGNGKLSEKVGLITMDEAWAGGTGDYQQRTENRLNYLYKSSMYWSISPSDYGNAFVYQIICGYLHRTTTNTSSSVVPVISLTSEYFTTLIGDGTIGNVFRDPNNDNEG